MVKKIFIFTFALGLILTGLELSSVIKKAEAAVRPEVEVVFCLDTTGSMGGLIEGAKQKIWSIANQIIQGDPVPGLAIGLVGYRDIGDEYVTRSFPLSDDLDTVFENLMSFEADGGGDTPEHVNRALHDAVHGMAWSEERSTLKLIFLVGDCPPHMDYQDGYDYRNTSRDAVRKAIIINTVQCGDYAETAKFWKKIAKLTGGSYAAIAQTGGMETIETPMDAELSKLNTMLEETVVAFGSAELKSKSAARKEKVAKMAPSAAAERAAYKSAEEAISACDLIDSIKHDKVKLEKIKDKELPDEMRGMSLTEKKKYLAGKEKERRELKVRIRDLSTKRNAYIAERLEEKPNKDSFDEIVLEFIKDQAAEKGISY